jgi:hypothetical protein
MPSRRTAGNSRLFGRYANIVTAQTCALQGLTRLLHGQLPWHLMGAFLEAALSFCLELSRAPPDRARRLFRNPVVNGGHEVICSDVVHWIEYAHATLDHDERDHQEVRPRCQPAGMMLRRWSVAGEARIGLLVLVRRITAPPPCRRRYRRTVV